MSVNLSLRSLFNKQLTLKRNNIDQAVYSHTHSNPQTCFSRKTQSSGSVQRHACSSHGESSMCSPTPTSVSAHSGLTLLSAVPMCWGSKDHSALTLLALDVI